MADSGVVVPDGMSMRPATMGDTGAVAGLIEASDLEEFGEPEYSESDLRGEWEDEELPLDTRLILTGDGQVVGYGNVYTRGPARVEAEGYVHPGFYGRGIGSALIQWTELRAADHLAAAPPGLRVVLNNATSARNPGATALLTAKGYAPVRYFWQMRAQLDAPPPAPEWPRGVTVRPATSEADVRAVYEAIEESFRDHWGHHPRTLEEWLRDQKDAADRSLWYLATDGDAVAGAAVCRMFLETTGWVGSLGVRRPWRGQGLGMALLRHAMAEFYRRGTTKIGLGVDAANPTGATRLYERAGMVVKSEYAVFQKELRAGKEPAEDH